MSTSYAAATAGGAASLSSIAHPLRGGGDDNEEDDDIAAASVSGSGLSEMMVYGDPDLAEVGHVVLTAHPPGAVSMSVRCHFLSSTSNDIVIVKSNRIEVRTTPPTRHGSWSNDNNTSNSETQEEEDTFPLTLILPINGRVVAIVPIRFGNGKKQQQKKQQQQQDCLFFLTEGGSYALISYDGSLTTSSSSSTLMSSSSSVATTTATPSSDITTTTTTTNNNNTAPTIQMTGEHYPILTHASGRLPGHTDTIHPISYAECGPLVSVDTHMRCVAVHVIDGHVVIFPINNSYNVLVDGTARRMPWRKNNNNNTNTTAGAGGGRSNNRTSGIHSSTITKPFNDIIDMRIEERTILSMTFLIEEEEDIAGTLVYHPQLTILHQDSTGYQHVVSHGVDLLNGKLIPCKSTPTSMGMILGSTNTTTNRGSKRPSSSIGIDLDTKLPAAVVDTPIMPLQEKRLSISKVEGGSGMLIAVPPMTHHTTTTAATTANNDASSMMLLSQPSPPQSSSPSTTKSSSSSTTTKRLGGVLILGQRLVTYYSPYGTSSSSNGGGASPITLKTNTGGAGVLLSYCRIIDDGTNNVERISIRYLIGDEYGRIHLLTLAYNDYDDNVDNELSMTMTLDVLGTTSTASSLSYLTNNRFFVGSAFGNSQLVQILDSPVSVNTTLTNGESDDAETGGKREGREDDVYEQELLLADMTYLKVLEEYDNLGPIVDFDLRPCGDVDTSSSSVEEGNRLGSGSSSSGRHRQSLIVTCSGVGNDGSIRLVRNGVGMRESASVEMGGIVGMWSLRRKFTDVDDSYLVQSFVRETRVLGVQNVKDVIDDVEDGGEKNEMEIEEEDQDEVGGALAEVTIPGFNSSKLTLFAGNVLVGKFDLLLQVVEDDVRLIDSDTLASIAHWSPLSDSDACGDDDDDDDEPAGFITVASANQCGQIIVALRGGVLVYLLVEGEDIPTIRRVRKVTLDREISCVDLNPFGTSSSSPSSSSLIGNNHGIMDVDVAPQTRKSQLVAVGLWDDFSVRLLNLVGDPSSLLEQVLHINLGRGGGIDGMSRLSSLDSDERNGGVDGGQHMMARSLCLVTLDSHATSSNSSINKNTSPAASGHSVDMLLVGLGDGKLISFVVNQTGLPSTSGWSIHSRKEVSLGTQGVHLIPFHHGSSKSSGSCVLATGDRPTIVYLTGGNAGSNSNPKLNYSTISLTVDNDDDEAGHASHKNISVNVATPFRSSLLFSMSSANGSSICVADDSTLRLGMIDNIQKLHVTSFKLGMTPRRIAYHEAGRVYCVGCIADLEQGGETNQNNCIRFFDDSTFEELNCITLEPFEMILSIESVELGVHTPPVSNKSRSTDNTAPTEFRPFIVMGTAFAYPDEDEPSQGRVIIIECDCGSYGGLKSDSQDQTARRVRQVADLPLAGGIYSIAPFYGGNILVTCGSDTIICQLAASVLPREYGVESGTLKLNRIGTGHHGHLISLFVKSLVSSDKSLHKRREKKQLAIVGDLMRSISLIEYYPKHQVIEELASDFNSNFCTDVVMLTDNIYMGSEDHNNLFVLRYNPNAATEQARIRLDTVGQYHLGENVNKMIGGSLVMPSNNTSIGSQRGARLVNDKVSDGSSFPSGNRNVDITIGSQTLFGTVDGTVGSIIGLGGKTFAFLSALQRAMDAIVRPVGDLSHAHFRAWRQDQNRRGSCGFVDGDWIETFLDLNRQTMEKVVMEMNVDPRWTIRDDGKGFGVQGDDVRQNLIDTDEGLGALASTRTLSVEDVLAAVEELSMVH